MGINTIIKAKFLLSGTRGFFLVSRKYYH